MAQTWSVSTVGVQPWSLVPVSQCGIYTADDGDFVLGRGGQVNMFNNASPLGEGPICEEQDRN